jgi:hypothetical protein
MLSPVWHLILPLIFRRTVLLCTWFGTCPLEYDYLLYIVIFAIYYIIPPMLKGPCYSTFGFVVCPCYSTVTLSGVHVTPLLFCQISMLLYVQLCCWSSLPHLSQRSFSPTFDFLQWSMLLYVQLCRGSMLSYLRFARGSCYPTFDFHMRCAGFWSRWAQCLLCHSIWNG